MMYIVIIIMHPGGDISLKSCIVVDRWNDIISIQGVVVEVLSLFKASILIGRKIL